MERRRQGFYMVQDPANQGVWEVWSLEEAREMQALSANGSGLDPTSPPPEGQFYKGPRRVSNPRAKRIGSRLEAITE